MRRILVCFAVFGASLAVAGMAEVSTRSAVEGVYSEAQAARGQATYDRSCSTCHGGSLSGADVNPPLAGPQFQANWKTQTVGDLANRIRTTMPLDDPGSLSLVSTSDVTAYILKSNGYKSGQTDLPSEPRIQRTIRF